MPKIVFRDEFGLEPLVGQTNYNRWARAFRIVALSKGLWRVFDKNQEDCYAIRSTQHETRLAAEQGRALLLLSIDPALRVRVENFTRPRDAWICLKKRYETSGELAAHIARVKAYNLRLQDCKNMTDYLTELQLLFHDLAVAGEPQELEDLVKPIVSGLGAKYTHFLQRDDIQVHIEMGDFPTLAGKLLRFETELGIKERANKEVEAEVKSTVVAEAKAAVGAEVKSTVEAQVKAAVQAEVKAAFEAQVKAAVEAKVKAAVEAEVKRTVEAKVKSAVEAEVKSMVEAKKVKAAVEAKGKSTVDTSKDDEADWEQV
jgi:hypothetical protein